ncbi:MAG TPA: glycosyltransferase family 1 protein [Burkholderiaceae bacterium]|nr:glycosyltransferase family 1 protein [Burkholderiaceae bacterium]
MPLSREPDPVTAHRPIVLVTDAWHPQVNGVVHTWSYVQRELGQLGHRLQVIHPGGSRGVRVPGEPDLLLSTEPARHVERGLQSRIPAALHIATEGPLGWAARALARAAGWPFTTSYHTRFPEYLKTRFGMPAAWTYSILRRFHRLSHAILVPTEAMRGELERAGFDRTRVWGRGVDSSRFAPGSRDALDLPRPILLYAGRVAPEKNLEAFARLNLPGSRVVIGDGPELARLRGRYPQVHWLGGQPHDSLARYYSAADVFVFPSRTDTFGLVMLEAMACGCPVAAYPVTGPVDVVTPGVSGILDEDLQRACQQALQLSRAQVRATAVSRSWTAIARDLLSVLVPIETAAARSTEAARA